MITSLHTGLRMLGRILRALVAAVILAGLLAGVPAALVVFVGWPLPELVTGWSRPLDDTAILSLLAVIAWIVWAVFARDVIVEILLTVADAAEARQGRPRTPGRPTGGPVRMVAAILVGAIAATVLIDTVHTSARAVAGPPRPTSAAVVEVNASGHSGSVPVGAFTVVSTPASAVTAASSTRQPPGWARDAPGGAHLVVKDDNYWDVAETTLGDPYRWREIWSLTRGQPQPDGRVATDPDKIYPGWWLALPAATATVADPPAGQAPTADHHATDAAEQPAAPPPTPAAPPATAPSTTPQPSPGTTPAPATSTPAAATTSAAAPGSVAATSSTAQAHQPGEPDHGVTLPSQAWVSLGLAGLIAAIATLLRLQRRRHARVTFPIPTRTGPTPSPVPASLRLADTAGTRLLAPPDPTADDEEPADPAIAETAAPIGLDPAHREVGLFDLTAGGIGLRGDGAAAAARASLASALATAATGFLLDRLVVITTRATLAGLLPPGVPPVGLDPHHETFDGDRLTIISHTGDAIAVLEDEMIHRRRLLETADVDTIAVYNTLDRGEPQPPTVLLVEDSPRHHARLRAITANAHALRLSVVIIGDTDIVPTATIALDGTITAWTTDTTPLARLSTLDAGDLVDVLDLIRASAARPEPGHDFEDTTATDVARDDLPEAITAPTVAPGVHPPIRLTVLGPVTLAVAEAPITGGLRSGSLAVLALLAAHPNGRTREQIMEDLHPGVAQHLASQRVGTDNGALRRVLAKATGVTGKGHFITYDPVTGRYRLDPDLFDVDLWRMITAIGRANNAADDTTCLAALREAANCYHGDFATDHDRAWATGYATTYRHQYLSVLTRIAEILEPDHPDQAVAAIEQALTHDPINEELYQRLMRIHGRADRPDEVRRVLRRLTNQLAQVGDAEPSEASRRVAHRQLNTPRPSPRPATRSA